MASRYTDAYEIVTGVVDMSTAIICEEVEGLFVVGSDGLTTYRDGSTPNPHTRKIFELTNADSPIVYAVMGNPHITEDESGADVVNFPKDIANHAASCWGVETLWEFAKAVCVPLNDVLRKAHESGKIADYPSDCDIVRVLFVGYFKGKPSRIEVRFFHKDQVLQDCQFTVYRDEYHYGSIAVKRSIDTASPRFKEYFPIDPFRNLPSVVAKIKNHIDAYGSPAARDIDPAVCNGIGGETQVCVVHPSGIEWIYGPAGGPRAV